MGLAAIQRAVAVLDEGAEVNRALTSYEFHVRGGRIFAMPRDGSPEIDIANGGQLMLAIDLRVRTRKELAKASARGSTARLLDEQVTLKRRKRRLA